jgi:hypothetical protein
MIASTPKIAVSTNSSLINIKYHLHHENANGSILASSSVLSGDSLCPTFEAFSNQNLFQQYYGHNFHHEGHTYVCAILTFKFTCCFNLIDKLQYCLSHEKYKYGLGTSMPTKTLAWIFEQVHSHLAAQTARCFCPISLQNWQLLFRPWSTAQYALAFRHGKDGSKHTTMMLSYVLCRSLSSTRP